jgi:hypothetical protein
LVKREGEATPLNMFPSTLPNPFLAREGEAPAEPLRRKLGRSLALPMKLLTLWSVADSKQLLIGQHDAAINRNHVGADELVFSTGQMTNFENLII